MRQEKHLSPWRKNLYPGMTFITICLITFALLTGCEKKNHSQSKAAKVLTEKAEIKIVPSSPILKSKLELDENTDPVREEPKISIDSKYNETARFLAGLAIPKSSPLFAKTRTVSYKRYKMKMDWLWKKYQKPNLDKMAAWRKKNLKLTANETVLYPFSGPDILNALVFYPDAKEYVMFGLEKPGEMPVIGKTTAKKTNYGLIMLNKSLHYLVIRNYFITKSMMYDMHHNPFSSLTSVMMFLLAKSNHEVLEVKKISIDRTGKVVQGHIRSPKMVAGVEISFRKDESSPVQKLRYFSQNVEHKQINRQPNFVTYLNSKRNYSTIIKAASFLMHINAFKTVRNVVLSNSEHIIQDSSGIPMKYFSAKKWSITYYGKYYRPIKPFRMFFDKILYFGTRRYSKGLLPFQYGYDYVNKQAHLVILQRKK